VSRIKSFGRGGRVLLAVAVAGGAFGIATVVQAAIPDTNGVVHGCYVPYQTGNTTLMTYLRLIDTQPSGPMANKGKACITGEVGVDLVGSGFGNQSYSGAGTFASTGLTPTILATTAVPAGNYAVTATGWAAGLTAGLKDIRCGIDGFFGNAFDTFLAVGLDTVSEAGQESFGITANVSKSGPSNIFVQCITSGGVNVLYGGQITAQRVGNLSGPVLSGPSQSGLSATPTG